MRRCRGIEAACRLAPVLLLLLSPRPAAAQVEESRFQLGVQLAGAASGEFDDTEIGVGIRGSWHPVALLGAEAEVGVYPEDFGGEPAFSAARLEGLFGMTVGPRVGLFRPFAKLRPGFVRFSEAPGPIPCIAIFPPPLHCRLAAGKTVAAVDVGGGLELLPAGRSFLRLEAGDRLMRYPAPALDRNNQIRDETVTSHDFRFGIGGGIRF
jgi:hypothetical protein